MAKRPRKSRISVLPTGLKDKPKDQYAYTDIGLTGLLNIHAGQINSARQVMWNRFSYFLVANSIFLPLLSREKELAVQLVGTMVGIVLCWIWSGMLHADRQVLVWRIEEASKFKWPTLVPDVNVFHFMLRPAQLAYADKNIYRRANLLIVLFGGLYGVMLLYVIAPWLRKLILYIGP